MPAKDFNPLTIHPPSTAGIFFTLAATFQPFYNAAGAYSTSGVDPSTGSLTPEFNASFGEYRSIERVKF